MLKLRIETLSTSKKRSAQILRGGHRINHLFEIKSVPTRILRIKKEKKEDIDYYPFDDFRSQRGHNENNDQF